MYIVHCPMAFDYEGADWLSAEPAILNPYFGDEMRSCGTVKEDLSFDQSVSKTPDSSAIDPHKHNH